jgi:hypothetical protein
MTEPSIVQTAAVTSIRGRILWCGRRNLNRYFLCVRLLVRASVLELGNRLQQQWKRATCRFETSVIRTPVNFETISSTKIVVGPTGPAIPFPDVRRSSAVIPSA